MVLGLPRLILCLVLVSLDCRQRLLEYFSESFSKKEMVLSILFLLLVPVQCLDKNVFTLSSAQSRKIV